MNDMLRFGACEDDSSGRGQGNDDGGDVEAGRGEAMKGMKRRWE